MTNIIYHMCLLCYIVFDWNKSMFEIKLYGNIIIVKVFNRVYIYYVPNTINNKFNMSVRIYWLSSYNISIIWNALYMYIIWFISITLFLFFITSVIIKKYGNMIFLYKWLSYMYLSQLHIMSVLFTVHVEGDMILVYKVCVLVHGIRIISS